jgi:hypothetical protein
MASDTDDRMSSISAPPPSIAQKLAICDSLREAVDAGHVGEIVAKHEKLILDYYKDVLEQAQKSFASAKSTAKIGFWVLIGTLAYVLLIDVLVHIHLPGFAMSEPSLKVGGIGIVSGALIEFIAGVNFWLYARASRQFSAFHICLERTHRYLVAYKIAEGIVEKKDETLRDLVCIMAHASMITSQDIDPGKYDATAGSTRLKAASAEAGRS